MWPMRLPLQDNELLSSWLSRNAVAMRMSAAVLMHDVRKKRGYEAISYIDHRVDSHVAEYLNLQSGVRIASILDGTVLRYRGCLLRAAPQKRNTAWVIPARLTAAHNGLGYSICPSCLAEDESPYYRVSWLLALTPICQKHSSYLRSTCQKCGARIFPWGAGFNLQTVAVCHKCYHCGADYRHQTVRQSRDQELNQYVQQLGCLSNGRSDVGGLNDFYNPIEYFEVLHGLIRLMFTRSRYGRLAEAAAIEFGEKIAELNTGGRLFELLTPEHRAGILGVTRQMISSDLSRVAKVFSIAESMKPRYRFDHVHRPAWLKSEF